MISAKLSQRIKNIGLYSLVLCCFCIPVSSSLMGATSLIALLCWVFCGKIAEWPRLFFTNPVVSFASLLFLLLVSGVFYSTASVDEALAVLKKYRELVFLVMAVSFFREEKSKLLLAEKAFIAGCLVLLGISYAMFWGLVPAERFGHSVVYHITHSFFMGILAFWALQKMISKGQARALWGLIFLLTCINLFYIAPGRVGMLILVLLLLLTVLQRLSVVQSIISLLVASVFLVSVYYTSTNFSSRVDLAFEEIQHYQPGVSRTSLGMRFDWWYNSLQLIKKRPFTGYGTGAFAIEQNQLVEGSQTVKTDNPHNEYLFLAVQVGIFGTIFFGALLIAIFLAGRRKQQPFGYLLQGVALAMCVGCIMNSFLFDSHQGHFFAIISGALLSSPDSSAGPLLAERL
ncbi:MAG: hypothetical protein CSA20_02290 [Deltaproteobacteria bacterium]|nr:MAG: hypothetical protein CSB23_02155 [Deltaproteobacteria bacterium]PIE73608.1 MAG: hypothetical protein CSA20_02290 [Deltaproteobacteria bacterium]